MAKVTVIICVKAQSFTMVMLLRSRPNDSCLTRDTHNTSLGSYSQLSYTPRLAGRSLPLACSALLIIFCHFLKYQKMLQHVSFSILHFSHFVKNLKHFCCAANCIIKISLCFLLLQLSSRVHKNTQHLTTYILNTICSHNLPGIIYFLTRIIGFSRRLNYVVQRRVGYVL